MKRVLVQLSKKDHTVEVRVPGEGKKPLISLGGNFYCPTCGYKMVPEIEKSGIGPRRKAKFFLDVACLCNA